MILARKRGQPVRVLDQPLDRLDESLGDLGLDEDARGSLDHSVGDPVDGPWQRGLPLLRDLGRLHRG